MIVHLVLRGLKYKHAISDVPEIFVKWGLNWPAYFYFGIVCFTDKPGYFPQLSIKHENQPV